MAKLLDTLMNRTIKGKLIIEDTDELSSVLKKAVEQADSSDIYEFPLEPTQAELEEAVKHKFIKNNGGYVFTLFLVDDSDTPNIHYFYGCVYGLDDGIANAGFDILDIYYLDEGETHYSSGIYNYTFSELLNFTPSEEGKVLVVDSNGQAQPEDEIVVKTLKQTQANETFSFSLDAEDTTNFERVGSQYCKIEVVNGELHIIALAKFHNTDTANQHNFRLALVQISDLPDSIAEKIYGDTGENLKTMGAGTVRVACMGINNSGSGLTLQPIRLNGSNSHLNELVLYQPNNVNVVADGTIVISFEVNLSLF